MSDSAASEKAHPIVPHPIVPPTLPELPLDALDAVNALIAEPWPGYVGPQVAESMQSAAAKLDGQTLASGSGEIGSSGWDFSLVTQDMQADFDVTVPPGFTSAPLLGPGTTTVAMAAPITGT
jgi:hypothetical protein